MTTLLLALLCVAAPALAEEPVYGNAKGCVLPFKDDTAIRVLPTEIVSWESSCALPAQPDYSGTPMTLKCFGEAEEWTETVSLKREGDILIYQDDTPLHRCD